MSEHVLELRNAGRTFHQGNEELAVLSAVNFRIKKGEIVALTGPSGSGKSTLLQIAGLLDKPSGGEVLIEGESCARMGDYAKTLIRRKKIGFVYQFHHLLPEFTAIENVVIPQVINGVEKEEARKKGVVLLESLGLGKRLTHRPSELSGGEQQRVAIARAVANNPGLLLADEPTGNLDHHTAGVVFELLIGLIRSFNRMGALVATHNQELVERMDRVITIKDGAVVET